MTLWRTRIAPPAVVLALLALLLGGLALPWTGRDMESHDSHITAVDYLRDEAGLAFAQVRGRAFVPAGAQVSVGHDPAVHWLRVSVPPIRQGGPMVLGIFPPGLDLVTLYARNTRGVWARQDTGDRVPMDKRGWKGASLGFVLPDLGDGGPYYLRVQTGGAASLHLTAHPMDIALVRENRRMALHAALLSLLGVTAILTFLHFLYRPTVPTLLLVTSAAAGLAHGIFVLGYAATAWPDWPAAPLSRAGDVLGIVALASSLGFHRSFLSRMRPARVALHGLDLLLLACAAALALYAAGHAAAAARLLSAAGLASAAALALVAWTAREGFDPPLRLVRGIYTAFGVASGLWALAGLVAPGWHRNADEAQALLNMLLLLALVVTHTWSRQRKLAVQKARMRDAELRQTILARSTEVKDKLLNMLVHEVRNHLAVIRISAETGLDDASRDAALHVVRDLEGTITDCIRLAWLERGEWRPKPGDADLVGLVLEALAEAGDDERIDLHLTEAQPTLHTDGKLALVALGALVAEAVRLGRPGAAIHVRLQQDAPAPQERWSVLIETEGAGAAGPQPAPVWNPDSGDAVGRASLSLAIAKRITELMGGTLTLDSQGSLIRCGLSIPARSTSL